jgi:hypothetical protein
MNTHESSQGHDLQVSDLVYLGQIEETHLEVSLFAIGVAKIIHELGDCLSEIDFVSVELINQQVHQLVISEVVAQHVMEVNEQGLLLFHL